MHVDGKQGIFHRITGVEGTCGDHHVHSPCWRKLPTVGCIGHLLACHWMWEWQKITSEGVFMGRLMENACPDKQIKIFHALLIKESFLARASSTSNSPLRSITRWGWWNVTEETAEGKHAPTLGTTHVACHFPSLADHGLQTQQGASDSKTDGSSLQKPSDWEWVYWASHISSSHQIHTREWHNLEQSLAMLYCKLRP